MDNRTNWQLYDNESLDISECQSWTLRSHTLTGARTRDFRWVFADLVMLLVIVLGNVLTILAVKLSRRLRNVVSNRLIASLALSDLVVGLSLLYDLFFYLNSGLGGHKATCLSR